MRKVHRILRIQRASHFDEAVRCESNGDSMDLAPRGASEGPQVEANERSALLSRLGRLLSPREECARSTIECTTLTERRFVG